MYVTVCVCVWCVIAWGVYVCLHVFTGVCDWVYAAVCLCMCVVCDMHVCLFAQVCMGRSVCAQVCVGRYVYVYKCVGGGVYMCTGVCLCVCTHMCVGRCVYVPWCVGGGVCAEVCVGGGCVHEHPPVLPAHTFAQILPHKARTVSRMEVSEDYGFPAEPESSIQGCIVSCTECDCSSRQPRIPDFSRSLQSREAF